MELNELKTIPEFKRMELPLDKDEYQRLENEILADGYKKPFIFWNEFLLMDYDAYEICRQHEVDVDVVNEDYPSVEVAISEISKHHLASEKTNENMKKYLIGCRFHAEKTLAKMKPKFSDSQYSYDNSASKTRERLAKEYGVNSQTIYKYGIYTDILNQIDTESHELFLKVLRDEIRVSIDALQAVLKMSSMPRRKAIDTLLSGKKQKTSPAVSTVSTKPETKERVIVEQTIKGIPVYNPDSELKSLFYTIPTWYGSLLRVKESANFRAATVETKHRLRRELIATINIMSDFLYEMEESENG